MGLKRIQPQEKAEARAQQEKNKKDNKGKSWQNLSSNEKWDIIAQDLYARGLIDTL